MAILAAELAAHAYDKVNTAHFTACTAMHKQQCLIADNAQSVRLAWKRP